MWNQSPLSTAPRRRLYDTTAGLYTATFPWIWRLGFRRLHAWLADQLRSSSRILDAGTGPGYWARHLSQVNRDRCIVGLDFSRPYLDRARTFIAGELRVRLVQADLLAAPFPTGAFDAILCSGVLDTLTDPLPALREFRRLLTSRGKLVLILRGKGGVLSPAIDFLLRGSIFLFRLIKLRSLSAARISEQIWNRNPVWPRLDALAAASGLRTEHLDCGRVITKAVMVPSRPE